jgi:hypothetical protein
VGKFYIHIIILAGMLCMCVGLLIHESTSAKEAPFLNKADAVNILQQDIDIHKDWLLKPEDYATTGTYKYHQDWIDDFAQIINYIQHNSCKYTKKECLSLLYKAQATHVSYKVEGYYTQKWNYDWFHKYARLILYIEGDKDVD